MFSTKNLLHTYIYFTQFIADQMRPGLNANEIQIPYDNHHKASSLVKSHQNIHNSVKYEVI